MDATAILLKFLKSKHYIDNVSKAKGEVLTGRLTLKKADDLFVRDTIIGMGTILEEDLEQHYYITTVKTGMFGNVLTQAIILRNGSTAEVAIHAHEGIIKQRLAEKAIQKLKERLC